MGSLQAHVNMIHKNQNGLKIKDDNAGQSRKMHNLCCAVTTCNVQEMLYPFPIEIEQYNAWLKVIGLRKKGNYIRPGWLGVCGDHFNPDDFTVVEGSDKPALNPGALPSLFPNPCGICGKSFKTMSPLQVRKHMERHKYNPNMHKGNPNTHKENPNAKNPNGKSTCSVPGCGPSRGGYHREAIQYKFFWLEFWLEKWIGIPF